MKLCNWLSSTSFCLIKATLCATFSCFHSWKNELPYWNILPPLWSICPILPTSVFAQSMDWSSFKNKGLANLVLQENGVWEVHQFFSLTKTTKVGGLVTCVVQKILRRFLSAPCWINGNGIQSHRSRQLKESKWLTDLFDHLWQLVQALLG